jgi:hypothetical protein
MPDSNDSVIQEITSAYDAIDMDGWSHADLIFAINTIRSLSKEIDLQGICKYLLNISMQQTGATKGLFLLWDNTNTIILQSAFNHYRAAKKNTFAESIVNFAAKNQKMIILRDVLCSSFFAYDNHIKKKHPKSIICYPLVQKGKTEAIIYLEDFRNDNATTNSKLSLLGLIFSQAANFIYRIQQYKAKVESEKHYRRLYITKQKVKKKTVHDIRSSINSILGHSQLLKTSIDNAHLSDKCSFTEHLDHIISRSWNLLNSFNSVVEPDDFGKGTEKNYRINNSFDRNNSFIKIPSTKHALSGNPSKSSEIKKIKLDYEINSRERLIKVLKKADQKRLSISKTMIIREINSFGAYIVQIGNIFHSNAIIKWGETLKEHTTNFNKNEMKLMMQWFPEIIFKVENWQPGKTEIKMIN